jgi:hypothetical protein
MVKMRVIKKIIIKQLLKRNKSTISYNNNEYFDKSLEIINENRIIQSIHECINLCLCTDKTNKIKGDICEVGTWKGGSAKLICEFKGKRNFYIFDNFEIGLTDVSSEDLDLVNINGDMSFSYNSVKDYLKDYDNVFLIKGHFPETAKPILNKKFSLVHFDVDTYKSTKSCIEFFYSKMSKGGIMLSHDYGTYIGVKKAFDEFFKDKEEVIFQIDSQCFIIKL